MVGAEAVLPEGPEAVDPELVLLHLAAALLEQQPLEMMDDGEYNLDEQDGCGVDSYGQQHDAFLGVAGQEEVDIEEQECQQGIVEQPTLGYAGTNRR